MPKLIATLNVIAWSGFWAFGYLALSAQTHQTDQMVTAAILAALGGGLGLWAYFRLVRYTENTGFAKPANRADKSHLDMNENGERA